MALTVSTRVLGKHRPLLRDFSVPPPMPEDRGGEELRLKDIIEHVVRQEVQAFRKRQAARRLDRVLSYSQIAEDTKHGKVDPASEECTQEVDQDMAVANALLAFEDGLYLVIIDEVERKSLEEPVRLSPDSKIVFLHLTAMKEHEQ